MTTKLPATTDFGYNMIHVVMYALIGCGLIAFGDHILVGFGVGLVFVAVLLSNLAIAIKTREDIRDDILLLGKVKAGEING